MLDAETIKELTATLPAVLDVADAALLLRVSQRTIQREILEGKIEAFRADGEWNILRSDFISYLWRNANL